MSIEVLDESGDSESGPGVDVMELSRLARFTMDQMRVHPQAELCIKLVDEATIAELNEHWMEKSGPTDVLAFPIDELRPGLVDEDPEDGVLGDLVVCPAVARRQVDEARATDRPGYSVRDEIELLTVHGILHLLGYDHAEPDEHREMFGLQDRLLGEWRGHRDIGQSDVGQPDVGHPDDGQPDDGQPDDGQPDVATSDGTTP